MPYFLTREDIYSVFQRENPTDVYPDGAPTATFANSDILATAITFEAGYNNLSRIYDNYFPQFADEKISDFETLYFGMQSDSSLPLQQRRDRIVAKIRTQRRTTQQDMINTVYSVIDSSIPVEIATLNCNGPNGGAAWILDESQLDINTYLNEFSGVQFWFINGDFCNATAADLGLTPQQLIDYQNQAYTYEVLIYGYTLSAQERTLIDQALNQNEPARSLHVILDGLNPANMINGDT